MARSAIVNGILYKAKPKCFTGLENGILKTPLPNPSLQVTADHKLKLVDAPVHAPGSSEVLLHIKATGICGLCQGQDIHFWKTGRIGSLVVEGDCILGHEAAGIVLTCGEGVTKLKPGDRVAVEPGIPCGKCSLCADGRYNLCEEVQFAGVYPHYGTIQRYKVHPAKWRHKLPDNISYSEGALLEPLSVVLHSIRSAGLSLGRGAAICGAGPIGLTALAAARASDAHPLVITDLEPRRLAFAKKFVPTCLTYQVDPSLGAEENAKAIRKLFGSDDYVAPQTILECGNIVVIGVGKPIMNNLPFMHISLAEINVQFINRYRDTWPAGIACLSGGILDLKELVSSVFPLEKAPDALHLCSDVSNSSIKVQIVDDVDVGIL